MTNSEGLHLDQVHLTGMLMSCVIGIFPNERNRKQPVTIDLCLYLNTRKAASSTNIHDTIDYAAAVKEISFILDQCEFLLIESAVETVCRYFLLTYRSDHGLPQVDAVAIRISKPSALTHGIVPAVQIMRRREDFEQDLDQPAQAQVLHDSAQGSLQIQYKKAGAVVRVQANAGDCRAALTIGKWQLDQQPLKPRTTVVPATNEQEVILTHDQTQPQLILVLR